MSTFRPNNNTSFRTGQSNRWAPRSGGPPSTPIRTSTLRPQCDNQDPSIAKSTSPVGPKTLNGILLPTKIFVGGIGPRTGDEEVRHLFATEGEVKTVRIVTDRSIGLKNNEPRRYAFVEFESEDVVKRVLEKFTKADLVLDERRLNIGPAFKKPQTFNLTFAPSSPGENGPQRSGPGNGPSRTSPPVQQSNGYASGGNQMLQQHIAQASQFYYPYSYGGYGGAYNQAMYYNGGMPYLSQYGGYGAAGYPYPMQISPALAHQNGNVAAGGSPNGSPTAVRNGLSRGGSIDYSDTENQQPSQQLMNGSGLAGVGYGGYNMQHPMGMMGGSGYQNGYQVPVSSYNNGSPQRYNQQQQPIYGHCNPYLSYAQPMVAQNTDYYSAY